MSSTDNKASDEVIKREQNTFRVGVVLAVAALLYMAYALYSAVALDETYIGVAATAVIGAAALVCVWLSRHGQAVWGARLLIGTMMAAIFFAFVGSASNNPISSIGVLVVVSSGMGLLTLPWRQVRIIIGLSILLAVIMGFAAYSRPEQVALVPSSVIASIMVAGILVIVFGFLQVLQTTRLRMQTQLGLSFGLMLLLVILVTAVTLYGMYAVLNTFQTTIDKETVIEQTTAQMEANLLRARQSEQRFLLYWQDEGLAQARFLFARQNTRDVQQIRMIATQLETLISDSSVPEADQIRTNLAALQPQLDVYEANFQQTVDLIEQRGFTNTGLEGAFRQDIQDIEAFLADHPLTDSLQLTILQIHRREKDYLLRGEQKDVDGVHELIVTFKRQVEDSDLLSTDKAELLQLIDDYQTTFDTLVEVETAIAVSIAATDAAAEAITPLIADITQAGSSLTAAGLSATQAIGRQLQGATIGAPLIALLVGIGLAVALTRQMTAPIQALVYTAGQIGAGHLETRANVVASSELSMLAATINDMAAQLQAMLIGLEARVTERTRDLQLAAEVGRDLSRIRDLDELLDTAVQRIRERFDLYYVQIYLVDTPGRNLFLRAGTGRVGQELLAQGHRLSLSASSINSRAATSQVPVLVADTANDPQFRVNKLLLETRSELAVPLLVGDQVVGVLDMQSREVNGLSADNLPAYQALAGQLAISISNAHLFEDIGQAQAEVIAQRQFQVRQSWEAFLNAIDRREQIGFSYNGVALTPVQDAIADVSSMAMGIAIPIEVNGEVMGTVAVDPEHEWTREAEEFVANIAQQIGRRVEGFRLLAQAEHYQAEAEAAVRRLTRESWQEFSLDLPTGGFVYDHGLVRPLDSKDDGAETVTWQSSLIVRGEPVGRLEAEPPEDATAETEALIAAVAARLSNHLENLRLTAQTEKALADAEARAQELAALNEMSRALSSQLSVDAVVETIYEYTSRLMDTSNFYVALYEPKQDEIEFVLDITKGKTLWHAGKRRAGSGLTEYLLRTRQPLLMPNNIPQHLQGLGIAQIGSEAQSWLGVPMIVGDQAIGVIGLQSYTTANVYNEQHLRLLTAVSSQAAIAIESARLFEQVQARARQEQILREVTARVHSAVDAQSVLRTAAQEISRTLGVEAFVYLEDQLEKETAPANGGNGHS